MDPARQEKVTNFVAVTGVDNERAEFFLQASGWNVELAISTFFENDGEEPQEMEEARPPQRVAPVPAAAPPAAPQMPSQPAAASHKPAQSSSGKSNSRIQTFSSWGASQQPEDDDDKDDQGQAYYAGGSDHSGQQILGPPRKGDKNKNVAEELFRAARQHGAEEVTESQRSEKKQRSHFVGTGYRLGESEMETSAAVPGAAKKKEPVTVILKMWKTGFTVNDGELRLFNDRQNQQFLNSIHQGEIPQELISMAEGGQVALDMEDHSSEDYVPPKQPKMKAFTGSGQTLGSESSQPSTSSIVTSATEVVIDPSLPVTNIQIRLADGSRLVAKFNHSHTVGDVRRHIVASRPQYAGVTFSLLTTLPSRQLTDDTVSLKDADLLNAAIMQKL